MGLSISVIICTFNGAARLPATFENLAAQRVSPGTEWDVLVVDNGSTDASFSIAQEAAKQFAVPFNVISEPTPGKAHALKLAFQTVQGEFFCIVDDDNLLEPDYLQNAVEFMSSHSDVGLIAGKIAPLFEDPSKKPADFDTRFARLLAIRDHGDQVRMGVSPVGAGMTGRVRLMRGIYEQIGTRLMDRVAAGGGDVGEDLEKEAIIRRLGWQVAYVPTLRMQHVMPSKRLTNDYIDRLLFAGMFVNPWLRLVENHEPHGRAISYRLRALADELRVLKYRALRLLPATLHPKIAKADYWVPFYSSRARGLRVMARDHAAVSAMLARIDQAKSALSPRRAVKPSAGAADVIAADAVAV